jgi:hypothetical protein
MKDLSMQARILIAVRITETSRILNSLKKWKIPIGILKTPTITYTIKMILLKKELILLIKKKNKYLLLNDILL